MRGLLWGSVVFLDCWAGRGWEAALEGPSHLRWRTPGRHCCQTQGCAVQCQSRPCQKRASKGTWGQGSVADGGKTGEWEVKTRRKGLLKTRWKWRRGKVLQGDGSRQPLGSARLQPSSTFPQLAATSATPDGKRQWGGGWETLRVR